VRRWVCRRCGSSHVQIAVEWCQSVVPVDHDDDELNPDSCGDGDVSSVLRAFCDHCFSEGDPGDVLERRELSPEQAVDADELVAPR
jgi:hypothetical protein